MSPLSLVDFKDLINAMPTENQAFTAKLDNKKWQAVLMKRDAASRALESHFGGKETVCISRCDLRSMALESDLGRFIMATLLWGYPNGMQGKSVPWICESFPALVDLLDEARSQPITDWDGHFKKIKGKKIKGVALSTYTKFLSFLPANISGYSALILDSIIIDVGKSGDFVEFAGDFSERTYPEYLSPDFLFEVEAVAVMMAATSVFMRL